MMDATKTASRAAINVSPEPFSNIAASLVEDILVFTGLSLAIFKPAVFLVFALIGLGLFVWLAPRLWRGIRGFFSRFSNPADAARQAGQREWTTSGAPVVRRDPPGGDIDASF